MRARERFGFATICCGLLLAALGATAASARTARMEAVARMLARNAQELARYSWKSRTEITVAGELLQVSLVQASHGGDGALIETPLPSEFGSQKDLKGLKKKARAFYEELQALTRSYVGLDPRQIQAVLDRAHAWEGQGAQGNLLHVQARGVIRQADKLDLWIDSATNRPQRLEVLTSLQGEPVRLTAEFATLDDGPSYADETLVETELKEKKMVVRTENFDHKQKSEGPASRPPS